MTFPVVIPTAIISGAPHQRRLCLGLLAWSFAWMLLGFSTPSSRAEAPRPLSKRSWFDPLVYHDSAVKCLEQLRQTEFVEMASAVLHGAEMGPNDGWFRHGSESRYGWEWLATLHGIVPSGRILQKDFKGPADLFNRLDRNHDGQLRKDDFDWSNNSQYARQAMPSGYWFRWIDANSNGRITREEWDSFFTKIAGSKRYVTPEDLREALPTMPPPRRVDEPPQKNEGPSTQVLMKGLLSGELGSPFPGPKVGQRAPDFTLPRQNGKGAFTLSQFRGQKPVVLVFGSFT